MEKKILVLLGVLLAAIFSLPHCALAQTNAPTTERAAQVQEIPALTRTLADSGSPPKAKIEAATLLLLKNTPPAIEALKGFLKDSANPAAQLAVADAMAATGLGYDDLVDPLFTMLQDKEATRRASAAGALASCRNDAVLNRLSKLARDAAADEAIRLSAVYTLSRIPDKRSVDVLAALLEADKPTLRAAAIDALTHLTGIRVFGPSAERWRTWWLQNKNKSREQWLSDLAEGLARQNATLESDSALLRTRLSAAMGEVYNATAVADRPNLILSYLKDPMPEVRLVGLQLANRRTTTSAPLPPETVELVHTLLADDDLPVRCEAASLEAVLNDPQALQVLLTRLEAETSQPARQAVVTALGTLRAGEAFEPLLTALSAEPNGTAGAAALALQRLSEKTPFAPAQRQRVAETLLKRYSLSDDSQPELREALLSVMGALGGGEFAPLMRTALADKAATVRLAAVRGLPRTSSAATVAADIAPLVADNDRGVRQAAIAALGALGAQDALETILRRTRENVEADPAVRQQAWDTALDLLKRGPMNRLSATISVLAGRQDAEEYRIRLLGVLLDRLADAPDEQVNVRLELAESLQAVGRPTEAAAQLDLAMKSVSDNPARAGQLWLRWIQSLLAADDASCLATMAKQTDAKLFSAAMEMLTGRLDALQDLGRHDMVIALADQALTQLKDRLTEPQRAAMAAALGRARQRQLQVDRARVTQLVPMLNDDDPAVRSAAQEELEDMPQRAVLPLVEQLRACCAADTPDTTVETAISAMLAKIAPELTGYDLRAVRTDKIKVLDQWLAKLSKT